jgi:pyrroloquinoline quinone biosynthesis protein E
VTVALSPSDRPQLHHGVRISNDPLSGRSILLFPEGILFLNETAAAVIRCCDSSRTVAEAVHAIGELYDDVAVEDVMSLLGDLIAQRLW